MQISRFEGAHWLGKHHILDRVILLLFFFFTNSVQFNSVHLLSRVWLFATPWTSERQASLSITNSWSPPKPMCIESVMPSNYVILCLLQPIFSLFLQQVVENVWFFSWQENISVHSILPDRFSIFFISDIGISIQLSSILLWRKKQQTGREIAYHQNSNVWSKSNVWRNSNVRRFSNYVGFFLLLTISIFFL